MRPWMMAAKMSMKQAKGTSNFPNMLSDLWECWDDTPLTSVSERTDDHSQRGCPDETNHQGLWWTSLAKGISNFSNMLSDLWECWDDTPLTSVSERTDDHSQRGCSDETNHPELSWTSLAEEISALSGLFCERRVDLCFIPFLSILERTIDHSQSGGPDETNHQRLWWTSLGGKWFPYSSTLYAVAIPSLLMCAGPAQAVDLCLTGMFKYKPKIGPDICLDCYPGTFMHHHLHTERICYDCTQMKNPDLEILVSPCNRFQDTQIKCIDGYFRTNPAYTENTGHCQECTRCPFAKGGCHSNQDTVCCPSESYAVRVNGEGRPECVRLCGPGQFLDVDHDQCRPCPANTFMHERQHTHIYCWNCNVPSSDNEVVIRPCTSTHHAHIGCKEGYYQRSTLPYPFKGCIKCQVCSENTSGHIYEARGCEKASDAVCCDDPDMIVVDTPEGPICQHPATDAPSADLTPEEQNMLVVIIKRCERGHYLSIDTEEATAVCLPCPVGTCMTETDHFRTNCLPCDAVEIAVSFEQTMTSDHETQTVWNVTYFVVIFHSLTLAFAWI